MLSVSELDLAARAGMSRETVNREIHKIKKDKLVKIEKNRIIVSDLAALEAAVGEIVPLSLSGACAE